MQGARLNTLISSSQNATLANESSPARILFFYFSFVEIYSKPNGPKKISLFIQSIASDSRSGQDLKEIFL